MPSTRGGGRTDFMEWLGDSDDDPDYVESESEESDIPPSMGRDRARWVEDNVEAIQELYVHFRETGVQIFGEAFFQLGNITSFSHFIYKFTTPGGTTSDD